MENGGSFPGIFQNAIAVAKCYGWQSNKFLMSPQIFHPQKQNGSNQYFFAGC